MVNNEADEDAYDWDDAPQKRKQEQKKFAETAATGFYKAPGGKQDAKQKMVSAAD